QYSGFARANSGQTHGSDGSARFGYCSHGSASRVASHRDAATNRIVAAVAGRGSLSRFQRFSRRLGIIRRRFAFQSAPLQQRLDVRIAPDKILEQTQRIGRTTATEQCLPEAIAILALRSEERRVGKACGSVRWEERG